MASWNASRFVWVGSWIVACSSTPPAPPATDAGGVEMDTGVDAGAPACRGDERGGVGAPCRCADDCEATLQCNAEEAAGGGPGGACTRVCAEEDGCGAAAICVRPTSVEQGLCAPQCARHDDCRAGWACFYGSCARFCMDDAECETGECDRYTRACRPSSETLGGVLSACTRDEDCRSGACLLAIGGHCMVTCRPEENDCPEEAACIGGIDSSEPALGLCLTRCSSTPDCPGSLECVSAGGGRGNVCFRRG